MKKIAGPEMDKGELQRHLVSVVTYAPTNCQPRITRMDSDSLWDVASARPEGSNKRHR